MSFYHDKSDSNFTVTSKSCTLTGLSQKNQVSLIITKMLPPLLVVYIFFRCIITNCRRMDSMPLYLQSSRLFWPRSSDKGQLPPTTIPFICLLSCPCYLTERSHIHFPDVITKHGAFCVISTHLLLILIIYTFVAVQ